MNEIKLPKISVQSLIAVGYLLTIVLVHFHLSRYYSAFNIEISEYLNPIEFVLPLLPFFSLITVLAILFIVWIYGFSIFNILSDLNAKLTKKKLELVEEEIINTRKNIIIGKIFKILSFVILILIPLSYLISLLIVDKIDNILILSSCLLYFLSMIFIILLQKHDVIKVPDRVRHFSFIAGLVVMFVMISYIYIVLVKLHILRMEGI